MASRATYEDATITTKSSNLPPHHIQKESVVINSMISDGCMINGNINRSIISSGVFISEGSSVKNTIIYQNVNIIKYSNGFCEKLILY